MIRQARPKDLQEINSIYNQAVKDGLRTAHSKPISLNARQGWYKDHSQNSFPIYIYENDDAVLGWISISPYRDDRQALDEVIEVSYYVDYDHHGEGIATKLMQRAVDFCEEAGYRIMVAILVSKNEPSIGLLQKFGFQESGRIPDAIHHEGVFRDHLYMYKRLDK